VGAVRVDPVRMVLPRRLRPRGRLTLLPKIARAFG
jgi:hypothetical protein